MTDSIANLLTVIRNGYLAKKEIASVPHSKQTESICHILATHHFLKSVSVKGEKATKTIELELLYLPSGKSVLSGIKRVSRPSVRSYVTSSQLNKGLSGSGIAIISTSKGLMTHKDARAKNLGGEVVCQVW